MFPLVEFISLEMLCLINLFILLHPFIPMPEHFSRKNYFFFHHNPKTLIMGVTIVLTQLMILLVEPCLLVCRIMQYKIGAENDQNFEENELILHVPEEDGAGAKHEADPPSLGTPVRQVTSDQARRFALDRAPGRSMQRQLEGDASPHHGETPLRAPRPMRGPNASTVTADPGQDRDPCPMRACRPAVQDLLRLLLLVGRSHHRPHGSDWDSLWKANLRYLQDLLRLVLLRQPLCHLQLLPHVSRLGSRKVYEIQK